MKLALGQLNYISRTIMATYHARTSSANNTASTAAHVLQVDRFPINTFTLGYAAVRYRCIAELAMSTAELLACRRPIIFLAL